MIKNIYQGHIWPYQPLLRKLQADNVSSHHFDASYPENYCDEYVYHLSERGVTLRVIKYGGDDKPLLISAFGKEDRIGEVEKLILEEEKKHRTVEAKAR